MKRSMRVSVIGTLLLIGLWVNTSVAMIAIDYLSSLKLGQKLNCSSFSVGGDNPPNWVMVEDPGDPAKKAVLSQTNLAPSKGQFNLALTGPELPISSGWYYSISTRIKLLGGTGASEAGIVFAAVNPNRFYALCLDSKTNSICLYEFFNGKQKKIATTSRKISPQSWHELSVVIDKGKLVASLDKQKIFSLPDKTPKGKFGLITKADSRALFATLDFSAKDVDFGGF